MERRTSLKILLVFIFSTVVIALTMTALIPFLNDALAVEVAQKNVPAVTEAPMPGKPEELLITAVYEMEENSKKITEVYLEIFVVGSNAVTWFEIPADTKINISEELYKSLQTYAPELPQYLKVSNMAESFSPEYGLTGCNRILSEVLGITVNEYMRADKESMTRWSGVLNGEKTAKNFFADYSRWLESSVSSLTKEERWMYYESLQQVDTLFTEPAPGSREKDGFLISGKRSKERLMELMLRTEGVMQ